MLDLLALCQKKKQEMRELQGECDGEQGIGRDAKAESTTGDRRLSELGRGSVHLDQHDYRRSAGRDGHYDGEDDDGDYLDGDVEQNARQRL